MYRRPFPFPNTMEKDEKIERMKEGKDSRILQSKRQIQHIVFFIFWFW